MKINLKIENDIIVEYQTAPIVEETAIEITEEQYLLLEKYVGCVDKNFNLVASLIEKRNKKVKDEARIVELKEWFDNYYSTYEQKYRRLDYLFNNGVTTDETVNAHNNLVELYFLAEKYRAEINELEKGVSL